MTQSYVHARRLLRTTVALALLALVLPVATAARVAAEDGAAADPATLSARGRRLIHAGKLAEAEQALRKAAKLRGQSIEALYDLARIELSTGDLRHAKNACKALVEKDEKAVLSQVCQARAFLRWRRVSRAQEYVAKARKIDPSHPEVLLAYADTKRMAGDLTASKDAYQQVLGLHPDSAEAYFGLGQLSLVLPERDAARKAFREVLAREPGWVAAQYELGRLTDGTEAVRLLEKAVAARPDWLEARLSLGSARLANGDAAGAEEIFRKVLATNPKNAVAHSQLGMVLSAKHDYAGAEAELTQALAGLPNDADTVLALGRIYAATDRAEDAFERFRSASSLDRQSPRALIEAGVYALKISRNALAQAFLERAIERAPTLAEAQARYADSLLARGEKAAAKQHYKLALAGEGALDRQDVQRRLDALE